MIEQLPNWAIANEHPSFYDVESATAIEMVAKLYRKVNDLIKEHNTFTEEFKTAFEEFKKGVNDNFELFATELRQEFQDFIDVVELKIKNQDAKIQNAEDYMKNKIVSTTQNIVINALANHEIEVAMDYDAENESLTLVFGGEA